MGLAAFLPPAAGAAEPKVNHAPIQNALNPGWRIPTFHVWRRVYQTRGASHFKKYLVTERGRLKLVADFKDQETSWRRMKKEQGDAWGRDASPQLSPGSVSPNGRWEWISTADDPEGLTLTLLDRQSGAPTSLSMREEGTFRFGARPRAWDVAGESMYVTVAQGPTGWRDDSLFRVWLTNPSLMKIGDAGFGPVMSPDGQWLVWGGHLDDNPAGWMTIGGKRVGGCHLMIYSARAGFSCQLTRGIEHVLWGDWTNQPASSPARPLERRN